MYDTCNSELPDNHVNTIAIDGNGTKWIGTDGGLAAFNENGINVGVKGNHIPTDNLIIYPNPCSGAVRLRYQISDIRF